MDLESDEAKQVAQAILLIAVPDESSERVYRKPYLMVTGTDPLPDGLRLYTGLPDGPFNTPFTDQEFAACQWLGVVDKGENEEQLRDRWNKKYHTALENPVKNDPINEKLRSVGVTRDLLWDLAMAMSKRGIGGSPGVGILQNADHTNSEYQIHYFRYPRKELEAIAEGVYMDSKPRGRVQ